VAAYENIGAHGAASSLEQIWSPQEHRAVVSHENVSATHLDPLVFRVAGENIRRVHVPMNRDDGRKGTQPDYYIHRADVAGKENVLNALEGIENPGVQVAMCVRYYANLHYYPWNACQGSGLHN
jgi:hypothetical protein